MTTAIVAGATGLIGRHLAAGLVTEGRYARVVTLVRRETPALGPAHTPVVVDFERLDAANLPFEDADVYCALGTTMRVAGSREAFRRVDFAYPVRLAALAAAGGARAFGLVSAMGASAASRVFYNRVKGEAERGVAAAGLASVAIFRPSLLLGVRPEVRVGESVAEAFLKPFAGLLRGPLANLRPIEASIVAAAMRAAVPRALGGVRLYDPAAMRRLVDAER